jgi:hypothetical protein
MVVPDGVYSFVMLIKIYSLFANNKYTMVFLSTLNTDVLHDGLYVYFS